MPQVAGAKVPRFHLLNTFYMYGIAREDWSQSAAEQTLNRLPAIVLFTVDIEAVKLNFCFIEKGVLSLYD